MQLDDDRAPSTEEMVARAKTWAGELGPETAKWAGTASDQDLVALFRMSSALAADINARMVRAAQSSRPRLSWNLP